MKKIYLLAAAVSSLAMNAQAADWEINRMMRPYVGADYIYSHAKHGGYAGEAKRDYNSWAINVGADVMKHIDIEAFFQQAGARKAHMVEGGLKSEFYAWGLDVYGRTQILCSNFNLLGSLGLADYNVKYKHLNDSVDKQRVGYRAGVGFSYDFTEHMAMRVMGRYTYIGMNTLDNLMEVTAGLRYTF